MDPRTLQIFHSFAWAVGVLLLIALAALAVVVVRRRTVVTEDPLAAPASSGPTDWVALLTAVQADRIPGKNWLTLGTTLAPQVSSCPPPLRRPLIAALDSAIARSRDPLASASMTQVRRALAVLPSA
jgi:hypothetical protein